MAAVVSHAMRRFPTTPPDTSHSPYVSFRGETSRVDGESALSRSMRYADPWLCGSISAPGGYFLAPAFVLCACPDYVNGTKRSSKKGPSTCKKCKGTRIPLIANDATKYGTVRYYSSDVTATSTPLRGGTVRVTSSSRPSILPTSTDPYNLVRKSRLSVSESSSQFRARSVSPSKGISIQKTENDNKIKGEKQAESQNLTIGRRSILECNINPYELVSTDKSTKENGITFLNGQRVRVQNLASDTDFDNVQLRLSTPTKSSKPSKLGLITSNGFKSLTKFETQTPKEKRHQNKNDTIKSRAKSESSIHVKENESNQKCKSILKKYSESSSSSITETGGSQFYITLPNLKKRVKFLVSNEGLHSSCSSEENESGDDNVFENDKIENDKEQLMDETDLVLDTPKSKRNIFLQRSLSDIIKKRSHKVNFYDTTALRQLKQRSNLKIDFSDLERLDGINQRIKKITSKSEASTSDTESIDNASSLENMEPELIESISLNNLNSLIDNIDSLSDSVTASTSTISSNNNTQEIEIPSDIPDIKIDDHIDILPKPNEEAALAKLDECLNNCEKIITITETAPSAPPRKRSLNKQNIQIEHQNKTDTNKTIVKITTPPVHKIQIKNEFPDSNNLSPFEILEHGQRKTSILINGDDCYSTVNVNDDVPLYQSSVVVKESTGIISINTEKPEKHYSSSAIYITSPVIPSNFDDYKSPIVETKDTLSIVELNTPEKDSEMLRELLRDPVEAVRRNLVPHVCGKSDVHRRRDKKIPILSEPNYDDTITRLKHDALYDDISSEHSSSTQYELMDAGSECYTDHSNRSSVTEEEMANRTKFYELLGDSGIIELAEPDEHIYECIKVNDQDPIYEDIEIPPPLPTNPPPTSILDDINLDKEFTTRSIFEGASKYDILSYLVDAKERGVIPDDGYTYCPSYGPHEDDILGSKMSTVSDSSEDNSLILPGALIDEKLGQKGVEIERNDSGVGSETSKSSLSKYRSKQEVFALCEDCETALEGATGNITLLCKKCIKKRSERKEIIIEIVETEEKYSKDLQIILEEFYQPMLVAGLLAPEQLSAIFLNVEELLENSQALAEKLRDAVDIASDQGDEDFLTVNIGKMFLESMPMLHAFETYCVRQGAASLLLASLEKDKELLRIFLRVSQMENTMLRRMNLNSFLMVPVQRVTKYPLLLARLYKVTPSHYDHKEELKEAQHKIELHLNHMNSQTKDVPSKLWRRIGSNSGRRPSTEMDLVNIKLRKIAVDVLEWNHEEAKFALEGKLLFTQPTDNNWRKGRTIKLSPVNAMLVINGKPSSNKHTERTDESGLVFSKHGTREAALLLVRDKNGRYSLLREPLYLDRCVIAADPAWKSYFEVQELLGKDTFIFKAEDEDQTNVWYKQLQYHAQGMGAWRKRRNALANIMINGMGLRS